MGLSMRNTVTLMSSLYMRILLVCSEPCAPTFKDHWDFERSTCRTESVKDADTTNKPNTVGGSRAGQQAPILWSDSDSHSFSNLDSVCPYTITIFLPWLLF